MTTSISTTTAAHTTAVTTASSTAGSAPTGLSSVPSSIASSAPPSSQGCSSQISAWFASCIDAIRGCLAKLPLIGSWFEKNTPATTTIPSTTSSVAISTGYTDAQLLNMISGVFAPAGSITTGATTVPVPDATIVNYVLGLFGQIQSPVVKIEAFRAVLGAMNSTDDIARQFYDALPEGTIGTLEASRSSFREQVWIANGRSSVDGSGHDHGSGYGDFVVYHAIRTPLAQAGAQNLRNALAAAAPTTGATGP
jgi:hypothetical protein